MVRIYIDKNVFSYLRNNEKDLFVEFSNNLKKYNSSLICFYSHAHLLDLERDKTDKKYEELKLIEQYVNSNFLILEHEAPAVRTLILTPEQAFDSYCETGMNLKDLLDIGKLFDIDFGLLGESDEVEEIKKKISDLKELLNTNIKINLASNIQDRSDSEKNAWLKLFPNIKDDYSIVELLKNFSALFEDLFDKDSNTYKQLRGFSINNLDLVNKYNIDIDSPEFEQNLKNTPLQHSFFEMVDKSIEYDKNNKEHNRRYKFFISAFNLLNILGIDKEKQSKAKFANTFNDSQHSFYAAHCDYLISNDEGLMYKSKVLYNLFNIETKVLSVEKFNEQIEEITNSYGKTKDDYIFPLFLNLKFGSRILNRIELNALFFGYFDSISEIEESLDKDYKYFYLYKEAKNYSSFYAYVEIEAITNKIVKAFGVDSNEKELFTEDDKAEIEEKKWKGRTWIFVDFTIILEFDLEIGICLNNYVFNTFKLKI